VAKPEPARRPADARATAAELDRVAWSILGDLFRTHDVASGLETAGFKRLIELRIVAEARRAHVPPDALAQAFERAIRELTGADRLPRSELPIPLTERDVSHE
jgi:hypothetical protein